MVLIAAPATEKHEPADIAVSTIEPRHTLTWNWLRGRAGCYTFRIQNHAAGPRHDHVFHELVFVESGTAQHETVDGIRTLRPGDLIILRPFTWHSYSQPHRLCIVNCLIDAPLMQRLGPLLESIPQAFDLFRRRPTDPQQSSPDILHASPAQREAIRQCLDAIMLEQQSESHGWQAAATASLLQFLVAVARLAAGTMADALPESTSPITRAVLDVATYLERHFTEPANLDELADRVHLSPAHLSRCFSRHMGMGIIQYLHRIRAEEACRLLRCTNLSIAEIATRLGYEEIAYFSRCFRAQIQQSPQQWRRAGPSATQHGAGSPVA